MKNCIQCGTEAPDDAVLCGACGRAFAFVGSLPPAPQMTAPAMRNRPDGSVLKVLGWIGFGLAALFALLAIAQSRGSYYDDFSNVAARRWLLTMLAAGCFQLGLILSMFGHLVRAIWFVSGPDWKAAPQPHVPPAPPPMPSAGPPLTKPGDEGAAV